MIVRRFNYSRNLYATLAYFYQGLNFQQRNDSQIAFNRFLRFEKFVEKIGEVY